MASYQFDIESDSETEACDTGNYNSRTVVVGGGRVAYVKQEVSAEKRTETKKPRSPLKEEDEQILKPADRIRPVSLPIERKRTEPEKKTDVPDPAAYIFKKIPWQLPKAPLDFPPPLDVPRVDAEKLSAPFLGSGDYTLVNPQKYTGSPAGARLPHRPSQLGSDKKNTRFCQFVKFDVNKNEQSVVSVENKCRNPACNFAHTMDVYTPLPCTYQAACNNGDGCKFFHSNRETKFEYYMRSALFPAPPPRAPGQFPSQQPARIRKY